METRFTEEDLRRLGYEIHSGRAVRVKGVMPSGMHVSDIDSSVSSTQSLDSANGGVKHPPKSTSKYRNEPCYVGDVRFDSKHEAEIWLVLSAQERASQISELHRQVPFNLHCGTPLGLRIVVSRYIADFTWNDRDGAMHIGDAKSVITRKNQVYQLKRQWLNLEYGFVVEEL